jgi:hypothetical protein
VDIERNSNDRKNLWIGWLSDKADKAQSTKADERDNREILISNKRRWINQLLQKLF